MYRIEGARKFERKRVKRSQSKPLRFKGVAVRVD